MLRADPSDFKPTGPAWAPPHPHTTAYANQPIVYPVADGRLFVRGRDAIYLRPQPRIAFPPPAPCAGIAVAVDVGVAVGVWHATARNRITIVTPSG